MGRVSQSLIDFANGFRQPPAPGLEVIETPRYLIVLDPNFPIPGPNSVSWIRCGPESAPGVIEEVRATVSPHRLPIMWTLDPQTQPPDFALRLQDRGIMPDPHSPEAAVMALGVEAMVDAPDVRGLELRDGLADPASFQQAEAAGGEAFSGRLEPFTPVEIDTLERRRRHQVAAGNRFLCLATVDGEPAGAGWMTLYAPHGAMINGGSVRPKFRGRGVYRALVAARLGMARRAGVPGVWVWGGPMSRPILERLGFESIGWRRFYVDRTTG